MQSLPNLQMSAQLNPLIVTWNCRSLTSDKTEFLRLHLQSHKPLAIVLTETHRTSRELAHWPSFTNYSIFPFPGTSRHGGGIAFLVRSDVVGAELFTHLPGFNISSPLNIPSTTTQWASLRLRIRDYHRDIILIGVYIQPLTHSLILPPLTTQLRRLDAWAAALPLADEPYIILCGDFNLRDPALGILSDLPISPSSDLLTALDDLSYTCSNSTHSYGQPTHRDGGILDLFFEHTPQSSPPLISSLTIDSSPSSLFPLIGSDHYAVTASLSLFITSDTTSHTYYTWNTDKASAEDQRAFADKLESLCSSPLSPDPLSPADLLSLSLSNLTTFRINSYFSSLSSPPVRVTSLNYSSLATIASNDAWTSLLSILHLSAHKHIGKRRRNKFEQAGWTPALRSLHRATFKAERLYRRNPTDPSLFTNKTNAQLAFRSALHAVHHQRWAEIKHAVEEEGENGKHKVAWSALNRLQTIRERAEPISAGIRRPDGLLSSSESESVSLLAGYFKQQLSPHDDLPPPPNSSAPNQYPHSLSSSQLPSPSQIPSLLHHLQHQLTPPSNQSLHQLTTSHLTNEEEVKSLLSQSSLATAAGPDDLNGALLRWASLSPSFIKALTLLINFCFIFHALPQAWKDANMLPLHKKSGAKTECSSYRPISITPIIMRRVERLIERKIKWVLDPKLQRWQAGFRKRRNTRQQILYLQHQILSGILRPSQGGAHSHSTIQDRLYPVIFLDISRAFDSVPHDHLLLKLWKSGIDGNLLIFLRSFLSHRRFRVFTRNCMGAWNPVLAGVPQGAVLSPLLYALFINDCLPDPSRDAAFLSTPGHLLYADDIVIAPGVSGTLQQRHHHLQQCLDHLGSWAREWKVRFSATKSGCVWFHSTGTPSSAVVTHTHSLTPFNIPYSPTSSVPIPSTPNYQYLGVWLDHTLSPHTHFKHMKQKCLHVSNLLRSIQSPDGPPGFTVIRTLLLTMLLPRITYGIPFISPTAIQYAQLNHLLFRPLLTSLALPIHVHRASLAVYTGVPVIQLQRDKAILQLVASTLRLSSDEFVSSSPHSFPVFQLIWDHCTLDAVNSLRSSYLSSRSSSNRRRLIPAPAQSFLSQFFIIVHRWAAASLLPPSSLLRPNPPLKWDLASFKRHLNNRIFQLSLERLLLESRGHTVEDKVGINLGRPLLDSSYIRGAQLPPLLSIPTSITNLEELDTLSRQVDFKGPAPVLIHDSRLHSKLRSRLVLNRSALNAVRNARDPNPLINRHCQQCATFPPAPETLLHTISQCPKYATARDLLKRKLRSLLSTIQARARAHPRMGQILNHEDILFLHTTLCTPFVFSSLHPTIRGDVLLQTGAFLDHIHKLRPF